jgi:hypothetical protein
MNENAAPSVNKKKRPIWLYIFVGMGIFVWGLLMVGLHLADSEKVRRIETANSNKPAEFSLTASQLHDEYKADAAAAANKYLGKRVSVTGTIHKVSKLPFFGNVEVSFADPNPSGISINPKIVTATFPLSGTEAAASLKIGQQATIVGTVATYSIALFGTVPLSDSKLVED